MRPDPPYSQRSATSGAWPSEEVLSVRVDLDLPLLDAAEMHYRDAPAISTSSGANVGVFASFHQQEQQMHRLMRLADPARLPIRRSGLHHSPCFHRFGGSRRKVLPSAYMSKRLEPDADSASQNWADALEAIVSVLRGRELAAG